MKASNLKSFALGFGIAISALGLYALAATLTTFKAGDVVSAQLINDNFTNLNADVAALNTKVTETAAKVTDAPGFNSTFLAASSNLSTTAESKTSITLDAPAAGFAVVTANFVWLAQPTNGFNYSARFNLSKTAGDMGSAPTGAQLSATLPTAGGDNQYFQPISMTEVFTVTSGPNTFHLNTLWTGGTVARGIQTIKLTAIYLPTRYGTGATVN
jgi:hypothetical protein